MATPVAGLPEGFVLDQQAAQQPVMPEGFVVDPGKPSIPDWARAGDQPQTTTTAPVQAAPVSGHAEAGPSDFWLADIPRRIGSWAINAATGMMSPVLRNAPAAVGLEYQNGVPHITRPHPAPMNEAEKQAALQTAKDAAFNQTGVTEYKPSTETGRIIDAAGTAAMAGMIPGVGGGIIPNAIGGAAGQGLIEHTNLPPLVSAMVGQAAGNKAGSVATSMAPRLLPGAMDAETRALAQKATDMGITVPMAKASNNPFIRYTDSAMRRMPFSGYGKMDETNQAAVNRNAAASFGETAEKITPEVLNKAYNRIGSVFENVGGRYDVPLTQDLQNELARIHQQAAEVGLDAGQVASVRANIDKIWDIAAKNNGVIPGNVYVNLTKRGESLDRLQGNRSTTAGQLGGDIRDALDQALQGAATTEDAMALQQARAQYKALKTVEPLTLRADTPGGATPSTGDISSAALLGRVGQQYKNAARAELGDIPLKDLAQVGQRFLKEPGSSGTAERGHVAKMLETVVAPIGAMLGHEAGVPLHYTLPPLAAALAGPPIVGSIMRSPSFVNRQINGPQFSPLAAALAAQPAIANQSGGGR